MKVAIVGYGGMGSYHGKLIDQFNGEAGEQEFAFYGTYDIDPARQEVAAQRGKKVFNSFDEVLADAEVDVILIATPNDFHYEYAVRAAKAGKCVICEKPVALSERQTQEMYRAAKAGNVLFTVHQNRRWDDDYLTAKKIFDDKQVGDVYLIESRVMGSNGIPGDWRKRKAEGGGMMLDWGVHLLDQMLQMMGPAQITSLYCDYSFIYGEEVDDGFDLTAKFDNGVTWHVTVDTNAFRTLPRWQLYGTEGTATIEDWDLSGGITRVTERVDVALRPVKAGNGLTKTMAKRSVETTEAQPLPVQHAAPFAFYHNFVRAVMQLEKPAITEAEEMRLMKLMRLAEKSARKNVVIKTKI